MKPPLIVVCIIFVAFLGCTVRCRPGPRFVLELVVNMWLSSVLEKMWNTLPCIMLADLLTLRMNAEIRLTVGALTVVKLHGVNARCVMVRTCL